MQSRREHPPLSTRDAASRFWLRIRRDRPCRGRNCQRQRMPRRATSAVSPNPPAITQLLAKASRPVFLLAILSRPAKSGKCYYTPKVTPAPQTTDSTESNPVDASQDPVLASITPEGPAFFLRRKCRAFCAPCMDDEDARLDGNARATQSATHAMVPASIPSARLPYPDAAIFLFRSHA